MKVGLALVLGRGRHRKGRMADYRALTAPQLLCRNRSPERVRRCAQMMACLAMTCLLALFQTVTEAKAQPPPLAQVEIFFATDRKVISEGPRIAFGNVASESLNFGKALVVLKGSAQPIFFDRFVFHRRYAPPLHIVGDFSTASLSSMDRSAVLALAADAAARAKRFERRALVFVHGFNTSFDDAVRRAAQIAHGLEFDGPVFLFSWPSMGQSWSYEADRKTASTSRKRFARFLMEDLAPLRPIKVQLLAHSMGSTVLMGALEDVLASGPLSALSLDEIVMAAPDVDGDAFLRVLKGIGKSVTVTMYVSNNDKALKLSECVNRAARIGSFEGGKPVVAPFVDVMDVSAGSSYLDRWQHNRVFEHPVIFDDLRVLLRDRMRPPSARNSTVSYVSLSEQFEVFNGFWRFRDPDTDSMRDSAQDLGWLNWLKWTGKCEAARK